LRILDHACASAPDEIGVKESRGDAQPKCGTGFWSRLHGRWSAGQIPLRRCSYQVCGVLASTDKTMILECSALFLERLLEPKRG